MSDLNHKMRHFEELRKEVAASLDEFLATLPHDKREGAARLFEHYTTLVAGVLEFVRNELMPPTGLLSQSIARKGDTRASVRFEVDSTVRPNVHGSRAQTAFADYLNSIPWREGVPIEHIEACVETLRTLIVNDVRKAVDETSITLFGKSDLPTCP